MIKAMHPHMISSAIVLFILVGCLPDKYNNTVQIWDLALQLTSTDTTINLDQVTVIFTNSTNGLEYSALSNAQGLVKIENIIEGKYIVSATKISEENGKQQIIGGVKSDALISALLREFTLPVNTYPIGDLMIKEVFYTSSYTPDGIGYLSDQFIEIYNNSNHTVYTDSLCFGIAYGGSGQNSSSSSIFNNDTSQVYLVNIFMIPGTKKKHPLLAGQSLLIAQDAYNHKTGLAGNPNSIDLSMADWETFLSNPDDQRDIDYAKTPNLTRYYDYSFAYHDWSFQPYGVSIVIFKIEDKNKMTRVSLPNDEKRRELITIPKNWVIDGFESLSAPGKLEYKKLPSSIDMSYCYCNGIYNLESCRRKNIIGKNGRRILIDTNSSFSDFEILPSPTPKSFK